MLPVMLQFAMNKASKLTSDFMQTGSCPAVKALPPVYSPNDNSFRFVSLLTDEGMNPDSWFPNNCNSSSSTKSPISYGIGPDKLHLQMQSLFKLVMLHSSLGMIPFNPVMVASSIIRNCFNFPILGGKQPAIPLELITNE
jgi:hypothetical protein